jgi:hypothetical protein
MFKKCPTLRFSNQVTSAYHRGSITNKDNSTNIRKHSKSCSVRSIGSRKVVRSKNGDRKVYTVATSLTYVLLIDVCFRNLYCNAKLNYSNIMQRQQDIIMIKRAMRHNNRILRSKKSRQIVVFTECDQMCNAIS